MKDREPPTFRLAFLSTPGIEGSHDNWREMKLPSSNALMYVARLRHIQSIHESAGRRNPDTLVPLTQEGEQVGSPRAASGRSAWSGGVGHSVPERLC